MPWGPIRWSSHGEKHFPKGKSPDELREWSRTRNAKYFLNASEIERLERFVVEHRFNDGQLILLNGTKILPDRDFNDIYMICDRIIGASRGIDTDMVRVEWNENHGALHGRPINDAEIRDELRDVNPAEFENYKLIRDRIRRGENADQLVKYPG